MATVSNNNVNTNTTTPVTNHTPTSPTQSYRPARAVSSPWTQIVRGESDPISVAAPSSPSSLSAVVAEQAVSSATSPMEEESAENGSGGNGNAGKKAAWNKPSNGAVEAGPVMEAHLWPPLSESARVSSKSSSESLKGLADGSTSSPVPVPQGSGSASLASQKQVSNNANPHSTPSQRHRPMKRNGGSSSSNGGISQPSTQGPAVEVPPNSSSSRDHTQRGGFVSQSHSANDHPQQRNSFRNRNSGQHPRADGSHHQNYGGRRNQEHGNQDWNSHRNFNGRDAHIPSQRVVPRFIRHPPPPPPPVSIQYLPPPPMRPIGGSNIMFPDYPSALYYVPPPPSDSLRGMPIATPLSPVYFTTPDLQLPSRIMSQIDYYFSNENLVKDIFLRQNMDDQGWVPVKLIAGFKKVSLLTDNISLILDAMRNSTVVEVQGDKLRRRSDWNKWIVPPLQFSTSSPQSSQDMLATRMQNISLDQGAISQTGARSQEDGHADALSGGSLSRDLNSQLPLASSEGVSVGVTGNQARN